MNETLIHRLKKRYPMLEYFTERPFGIEIEGYGLQYYLLPPDNGIVKPYNIQSCAGDGRRFDALLREFGLNLGSRKDSWHIEEDSSITHRGAFELISPILSGMDGLVQVYRFLELLGRIKGVEIDESCGFHVHHGVDAKTFTCRQLQELVRIVYSMEDYFYLLIPGDRQNNATCRPVEVDVRAFLDPQLCAADPETSIEQIKKLWYSSENRFECGEDATGKYDKTRYHGLNLHSYWYRSTIEFRYHSAVLHNRDEAMQWIIFTQFLVELSEGRIPEVLFMPDANKWLKAIYKIYLAFGHLDRMRRVTGYTRKSSAVLNR
ncbi:MAG: hypothetical protein GX443_07115 [Deltaproteobacteria bacterium]|nr:hypothetical protein [Deltaproteobacteria bacterium]